MSNAVITKTTNFKYDGDVSTDMDLLYQQVVEGRVVADKRLCLFSFNTDFDANFDWYKNYLETAALIAERNRKAYITSMLDLGYIPVVYMPTVKLGESTIYIDKLRKAGFTVQCRKPYSFRGNIVSSPDTTDAWVHKLEIEEKLNIPLESVTAFEVFRRVCI